MELLAREFEEDAGRGGAPAFVRGGVQTAAGIEPRTEGPADGGGPVLWSNEPPASEAGRGAEPAGPAAPAGPAGGQGGGSGRAGKGKKKRNIDVFLEEMEEEERLGRGPRTAAAPAYRDPGDATTTNIFVGNIDPRFDEGDLRAFFATVGPVASVKIMWPRTQAAISNLTGFVAYEQRGHAKEAMAAFQGSALGGRELRLGWGKPVPAPAGADPRGAGAAAAGPAGPAEAVGGDISQDGTAAQGGLGRSPRATPADGAAERAPLLNSAERATLGQLLDRLSLRRSDVEALTVFAVERPYAAAEVVDGLRARCLEPAQLAGYHVAVLFAVSDLLSNAAKATATGVSAYRTPCRAFLPQCFGALRGAFAQAGGRMEQDAIASRVDRVLSAWAEWMLFSKDFLASLSSTFRGTG